MARGAELDTLNRCRQSVKSFELDPNWLFAHYSR